MDGENALLACFLPQVFIFDGIDDLQQQSGWFVWCPGHFKSCGGLFAQVLLDYCRAHLEGPNDDISQSYILLRKVRHAASNPHQ